MDRQQALKAVEGFFGRGERAYRSWTLDASRRKLGVVTVHDAPWPGCRTHIAFDGAFVEWPGVRPAVRLLPILPAEAKSDPDGNGSFHAAYLLDWALSKGVPPRPGEIILSLGHDADRLPHIRFDYPFPWEHDAPATIPVGDFSLIPVMAYAVSDAEAKFQNAEGAEALEGWLAKKRTHLFDRSRRCSGPASSPT